MTKEGLEEMSLKRSYNLGWFPVQGSLFGDKVYLDDDYGRWVDNGLFNQRQHNILATDYNNFAVVYGCYDILFGIFHL